MRLGDILVTGSVIRLAEVGRGLAHARATGLRLGAALVDLGVVGLDDVARALARQHRVPAALEKHLARRDQVLAGRLDAEVARTLVAVPIALSPGAGGVSLVVCFRDPTPQRVATITARVGCPVIACVACEAAVRRELDAAYPPHDDDSIDIDLDDDAAARVDLDGQAYPNLARLELVGLDDAGVSRDDSQSGSTPMARAASRRG